MSVASAISTNERGIPPLDGRLLWVYRVTWVLLAAAALAVFGWALLDDVMQPLVLALRLVKSTVLIAVAAILFWRKQRDPVAAILSLAFLCWTITSSFDFTTAAILPMLLDRLRFLLFAFALLLFPDGKWKPRWTRSVAIACSVVFAIGAGEAVGLLPTSLFLPFAIMCVLAAIAALIRRFRTTPDETQQQQLKWVALGLVSGIGLILTARAAAALAAPALAFEGLFQLGIILVALGFLVPLLRYRLYDAESVISRSAAYAVLTAALVATFAGSEALIEALGQQYLGSGIGQVSGAVAAAVAAVLLTPLNHRINSWAEQRFQRDLAQLKTELPDLLSEIPMDWTPSQVGNAALPRITAAVHATRAAISLNGEPIAAEGISSGLSDPSPEQFPLRLELRCPFGGHHGWLLVGPRPDGSSYGRDDIEALESVLRPLRRALLASLGHQEARHRADRTWRQIRNQLDNVSVRLAELEASARSTIKLGGACNDQ